MCMCSEKTENQILGYFMLEFHEQVPHAYLFIISL